MKMTQFGSRSHLRLISAGQHLAICTAVVDVGTQSSTFAGQPTFGRKLMFLFDVLDQVDPKSGKPLGLGHMFTASMHSRARLRHEVENWIGVFADQRAANDFDLSELVGRQCRLAIRHDNNGVRVRAVIGAILPALAHVDTSAVANDPLYFSLDNPDLGAFDRLPARLRNMIEASPEWRAIVMAA
ncbi:phage replication initiation protein, NGO0469 family [Burkholderia ambifaria]|uniref:phage replication initiation protein, NGO0469 family n=1 Tax=Burkholderia ambifaria TaxID=152480 RepID=UPI00158A9E82|nr:hypothetical protein [Burkholderia ambifaria]